MATEARKAKLAQRSDLRILQVIVRSVKNIQEVSFGKSNTLVGNQDNKLITYRSESVQLQMHLPKQENDKNTIRVDETILCHLHINFKPPKIQNANTYWTKSFDCRTHQRISETRFMEKPTTRNYSPSLERILTTKNLPCQRLG